MDRYRPPDSDSEEEGYDGFYFGDDHIKPARRIWAADDDQKIYDAVISGDLEPIRVYLSEDKSDINEPLRGGNTLLHHACQHGHIEIVKYLLELEADPNRQIDSLTPLMSACSSRADEDVALEIVKILLEKGAVVNISNRHGMTPLMFACIHGQTKVAEALLPIAFVDASDNQGWTPIFHAIENNRPEIVKLLVSAGANVNVANVKGYVPRQVAQFHGFEDILELLPPEEPRYVVPTNYLSYSRLSDYIPRLFLKSGIPEYFPDIDVILRKFELQRFTENFAKNKIKLGEFLTMNDEKLKSIDIELPLHRKKILLALLRFHLEHWSVQSINRVSITEPDTFYDILMIVSNQIKHVIVITAAIQYIRQNIEQNLLGPVSSTTIRDFYASIQYYKQESLKLYKTSKYQQSFSPARPPLYINYDEMIRAERRAKLHRYFNYSVAVSVVVLAFLKWKRFIQ